MTRDLRPESSLPARFISKAGDSEGTELCQGHHGCRGQRRSRDSPEERYKTASRKTRHVPTSLFNPAADDSEGTELCQASWLPGPTPQHRPPARTIPYPGPNQGSYPSPHSRSTARQMTGEGTVLLHASWLPGSTPNPTRPGRMIQNCQPKNGSCSHVPVQSRSR